MARHHGRGRRCGSGRRARRAPATSPNTRQPATIVPATLSTSTISATWTAPITEAPSRPAASICPGVAVSVGERPAPAVRASRCRPSTANSGASASITSPLSQPANSPRVPSNSARTTKIGPTASSTASAIRAVTSTPTVPSSSSIAPSHISALGRERRRRLLRCCRRACGAWPASRCAWNTRSICLREDLRRRPFAAGDHAGDLVGRADREVPHHAL